MRIEIKQRREPGQRVPVNGIIYTGFHWPDNLVDIFASLPRHAGGDLPDDMKPFQCFLFNQGKDWDHE